MKRYYSNSELSCAKQWQITDSSLIQERSPKICFTSTRQIANYLSLPKNVINGNKDCSLNSPNIFLWPNPSICSCRCTKSVNRYGDRHENSNWKCKQYDRIYLRKCLVMGLKDMGIGCLDDQNSKDDVFFLSRLHQKPMLTNSSIHPEAVHPCDIQEKSRHVNKPLYTYSCRVNQMQNQELEARYKAYKEGVISKFDTKSWRHNRPRFSQTLYVEVHKCNGFVPEKITVEPAPDYRKFIFDNVIVKTQHKPYINLPCIENIDNKVGKLSKKIQKFKQWKKSNDTSAVASLFTIKNGTEAKTRPKKYPKRPVAADSQPLVSTATLELKKDLGSTKTVENKTFQNIEPINIDSENMQIREMEFNDNISIINPTKMSPKDVGIFQGIPESTEIVREHETVELQEINGNMVLPTEVKIAKDQTNKAVPSVRRLQKKEVNVNSPNRGSPNIKNQNKTVTNPKIPDKNNQKLAPQIRSFTNTDSQVDLEEEIIDEVVTTSTEDISQYDSKTLEDVYGEINIKAKSKKLKRGKQSKKPETIVETEENSKDRVFKSNRTQIGTKNQLAKETQIKDKILPKDVFKEYQDNSRFKLLKDDSSNLTENSAEKSPDKLQKKLSLDNKQFFEPMKNDDIFVNPLHPIRESGELTDETFGGSFNKKELLPLTNAKELDKNKKDAAENKALGSGKPLKKDQKLPSLDRSTNRNKDKIDNSGFGKPINMTTGNRGSPTNKMLPAASSEVYGKNQRRPIDNLDENKTKQEEVANGEIQMAHTNRNKQDIDDTERNNKILPRDLKDRGTLREKKSVDSNRDMKNVGGKPQMSDLPKEKLNRDQMRLRENVTGESQLSDYSKENLNRDQMKLPENVKGSNQAGDYSKGKPIRDQMKPSENVKGAKQLIDYSKEKPDRDGIKTHEKNVGLNEPQRDGGKYQDKFTDKSKFSSSYLKDKEKEKDSRKNENRDKMTSLDVTEQMTGKQLQLKDLKNERTINSTDEDWKQQTFSREEYGESHTNHLSVLNTEKSLIKSCKNDSPGRSTSSGRPLIPIETRRNRIISARLESANLKLFPKPEFTKAHCNKPKCSSAERHYPVSKFNPKTTGHLEKNCFLSIGLNPKKCILNNDTKGLTKPYCNQIVRTRKGDLEECGAMKQLPSRGVCTKYVNRKTNSKLLEVCITNKPMDIKSLYDRTCFLKPQEYCNKSLNFKSFRRC